MIGFVKSLGAAVLLASAAVPAAAQYYSQPYPTPYPQQPYQQTYPYPQQQQTYPGYGYQQGYPGNPVTDVIDQLLGNRYSVTDRQAVRQCARAAQSQALSQYGGAYGYGQQGYGYGQQGYAYRQGIAAPGMHVTAITEVSRRSHGLRVSGTMSSGYAGQYGNQYGQYGNRYGYPNQAYGTGDVSFRCNVDYSGAVTDVRVGHNGEYRRY